MPRPRLFQVSALIACAGLLLASSNQPRRLPSPPAPADTAATLLATLKPTNIFEPAKGVVSPDGRALVYEQLEGFSRQLWHLDLATGSRKQLTTIQGVRYGPAWSPDGRQIAYAGEVLYPASGEMLWGLWVIDGQGGPERLVYQDSPADGAVVSNPSWATDARILFDVFAPGFGPQDDGDGDGDGSVSNTLWRVGLDGRGLERVTQGSADQSLGMTSPDGKRIGFIGQGCDGKEQGLWTMNADGSQPVCLARAVSPSRSPLWSADGSKLYVTALSVGGPAPVDSVAGLFLVRAADGASSRLPTPRGEVVDASVLADGRVVSALYRPTAQIATLPINGGRPVPVSTGELPALRPAWRPDGQVLGFTRGSWQRTNWQSSWEIAAVSIDHGRATGAAKTLADVPGGATDPAWSPDGRILSFARPAQTVFSAKRLNATKARLLTLANADRSTAYPPAWTPSGDAVVLPGGEYGNLNKTAHFHDLGGGKNGLVMATAVPASLDDTTRWNASIQALTLDGFDGIAAAPSISPDGQWIAFSERWQKDTPGIYIVPIGGGRVQKVADAGPGEPFSGPEWTADGRRLVFARADGLGGFHLVQVPREGGPPESLTPAVLDVLHPRRSPDGTTLAVTLWSAPTEFRLVATPVLLPATREPVRPPAMKRPASARASDLSQEIVALAQLITTKADTVARAWPGVWSPDESFVIVAPVARQTLIVAPGVPLAGAVPVDSAGLPARLQGRAFLLRETLGDPTALGLPFVSLESFPSDPVARRKIEERLLAGLYYLRLTGREDPALPQPEEWRMSLPHPSLDSVPGQAPFSHQPSGYGCPLGDGPSCAAMIEVEQRLLSDALSGPREALRSRLRDYVAVRWVRMLSDFTSRRGELTVERAYGAAGYVARRAALLATDGGLAGYEGELIRVLGSTTGDEPPAEQMPRLRATAEATALALDRLEVPWRPSRRDSMSMFDVLSRASGFDSTLALPTLVRAMSAYQYPKLVAAARQRVPTPNKTPWLAPPYHLHQYFARALGALDDSAGVRPLVITIETARAPDSAKVRLDIEPGPAGKISAGPGYALYPDARRVHLEVGGLTIDLRNCPVALDPKAHNSPGFREIRLYPPREFRDRIREQQPPYPGTPQELQAVPAQVVRGGNAMFRAESSVLVSPAGNGVFVNPWVYWLSPSPRRPDSAPRR